MRQQECSSPKMNSPSWEIIWNTRLYKKDLHIYKVQMWRKEETEVGRDYGMRNFLFIC